MHLAELPLALPAPETAPEFPRLVFVAPAWKSELQRWPCAPARPKWRWRGNVAHVRFQPVGFRLVETEAGWSVAHYIPNARKADRIRPLAAGLTWCEADAVLRWCREDHALPVWPPIPHRVGGARHDA